jgi:hypothetical protein
VALELAPHSTLDLKLPTRSRRGRPQTIAH